MKRVLFISLLVCSLFVSCVSKQQLPVENRGVAAKKLETQVAEFLAQQKASSAVIAQRDSDILSDAEQAVELNAMQEDTLPRTAVEESLRSIIQSLVLTGVTVSESSFKKTQERNSLILAGRLDEARRVIAIANKEKEVIAERMRKLAAELQDANERIARLQAEAREEQRRLQAEWERKLKDANDAALAELNKWWTIAITTIAVLSILAGTVIGFQFPLARKFAVGLAAGGAVLLGSVRVMNHPAFPYVFGAGVLISIFCGYLWYRQQKKTSDIEARLRRTTQSVKDEASAAWGEVKAHALYWFPRNGDKKNPLEEEIDRRNKAEGINAT